MAQPLSAISFCYFWVAVLSFFHNYLTVNEWGWVSYEEGEVGEEGVTTASTDNTLWDLYNSSYDTKAEFNNCFIIHSKEFLV